MHCCLYFVPPRVHGLRQIDLTFMKRLHEQVVSVEEQNRKCGYFSSDSYFFTRLLFLFIPVIAKSDSLTLEERRAMKARIRAQLKEAEIHVYYSACWVDISGQFSPNLCEHLPNFYHAVVHFPDCQETPLAMDTCEYEQDTKFVVDQTQQPFSVIGSNCIMDGRLRARKYRQTNRLKRLKNIYVLKAFIICVFTLGASSTSKTRSTPT